MSNRDRLNDSLAAESRTGIMAHLVAGYPDHATTVATARAIAEAGADVLELQFPFSDPLADGPTVLGACQEALDSGSTHAEALDILREITAATSTPTVVMTYANVPFIRGFDVFARELAEAGACGVIVPDLPHTEPEFRDFHAALEAAGLAYIPVVAPTSTDPIITEIAELAHSFLYVVIRLGVTGAESTIDTAVQQRLTEVAGLTAKPLAAGFGIRSREQVVNLAGHARLAVVGSKIVNTIRESGDDAPQAVQALVRSLCGK